MPVMPAIDFQRPLRALEWAASDLAACDASLTPMAPADVMRHPRWWRVMLVHAEKSTSFAASWKT